MRSLYPPLFRTSGLAPLDRGRAGAWLLAGLLCAQPVAAPALPASPASSQALAPMRADFGPERVSPAARALADWVVASRDNQGMPFLLVDKTRAMLYVFDSRGRLRGAAPVLLGLALGDDAVPGIGERPLAQIQPTERTTPAGRFTTEWGQNASGEQVLWIDYDNAVSMHRVRTLNPRERRLERLASPNAADRRISFGCINLPVAFFDRVVLPLFQGRNSPAYVLPDTRPLREVFPLMARQQ